MFIQLLVGFINYNFIEYVLHRLSHNKKWGGYIYKYHIEHHKVTYPIHKLLDKAPYKTNSEYFYFNRGTVAFMPITIILLYGIYYTLPLTWSIIILPESTALLLLSDYLHQQYHIDGSWLEKYNWFLSKRKYHLLHHNKMTKNFSLGGLTYSIDKVLNTFEI